MDKRLFKSFFLILPIFFLSLSSIASAAEVYQDQQGIWRSEVVEVTDQRKEDLPGTGVIVDVQDVRAEILEGNRAGEIVSFENDYIQLKEGDKFYLNYTKTIDGFEYYSVHELDRRGSLIGLLVLFAFVIIVFAGKQGVRSLISLVASLFVIAYVLVPGLIGGFPPVLTSVLVATGVLFFAIFLTHGFNKKSLIAFLGTVIAVALTGLVAHYSIQSTGLTGFASEESTFLNLNTGGELDFVGLLLAAIIIGSLGVLDDIAITQVSVVKELMITDRSLSKREIYSKALNVGKDHVGALVNTLVLAYTGAALPLILLFSQSEASIGSIVNREIFATEIVRSLVGSIGLILTVPITTLLAVLILKKNDTKDSGGATELTHAH